MCIEYQLCVIRIGSISELPDDSFAYLRVEVESELIGEQYQTVPECIYGRPHQGEELQGTVRFDVEREIQLSAVDIWVVFHNNLQYR